MNIEPNLTLVLSIIGTIVTPILLGGWVIYNRLASKIEKIDLKIEDVRKEAKEDRNYDRQERKQERESDRQEWKHEISKIENRFERLETKLDRLVDIILMQKQNYRPHRHRPKPNKDVG